MEQDERNIWSISQLNRYIRDYLEQDVHLQMLWVRGEISNFKHHSRGHMYFTLKDEVSRINAVMFARQNRHLKFLPKDGDKVLVRCTVSMYEIGGQVQIYVKEMQPDGVGNLFLAFEQLKQRLQKEGLFAEEQKRSIPKHPRTVGIVTSPTGAAVRDIVTTISRRSPYTNILLFPAVVQGENAATSIVTAIDLANRQFKHEVDVLIVGRGGGSLEELWAFNEEDVARAIYASDIPIIAAIGHETDVTIADFVADLRAATPTAAAELAVPFVGELKEQVQFLHDRLHTALERIVGNYRERLERSRQSSVMKRPTARLSQYEQRLDYLQTILHRAARSKLQHNRSRLERLTDHIRPTHLQKKVVLLKKERERLHSQLISELTRTVRDSRSRFDKHLAQLDALSPLKVMQRGYSLVYREKDRKLVKSAANVQLGDIVHVHLADGKLDCQVWGLEEKDHGGE